MFFSRDFVMAPHPVSMATGAVMFLLATIVFLIAICFYIFAFFKLPSSTQELLFLEEAKVAIDRHKRRSTRPKAKKTPKNG